MQHTDEISMQNHEITLFSFRRCPFAIRVRMVLEEKNISYTLKEENLKNLSEELKSLHPQAKVPLLVHQISTEKQIIYQSSIITEYLDETFKQNPLMPKDPIARMHIRLWTYWCDSIFKPDLDLFKYKRSILADGETNDLISRLHQHLSKWDLALQNSTFLVQNQLTLADLHLFPFARQFWAIQDALPGLDQYTNIQIWLDGLLSRPSFIRAMQR